jgi:hypothetical protein
VNGVRWREETGFEGRCDYCRDWWPLTLEFWQPRWSMARCRACINLWRRTYQNAKYRDDPAFRYARQTAAALSDWKARQWRPEERRERRKAYYEANRPQILARQRARYQANREAILARRRRRAA